MFVINERLKIFDKVFDKVFDKAVSENDGTLKSVPNYYKN